MNNNPGGRQGARPGEANNRNDQDEGLSWWKIGLGVGAGVATLAGGLYMLSKIEETQAPQQTVTVTECGQPNDDPTEDIDITMNNVTDSISRLAVSSSPAINNLDSLLNDIHVRYILIKKEDFSQRYDVFLTIFNKLHVSMKAVDSYYERYSSRFHFKPDEFNLNIVIGLPVNIYEDHGNPEESDLVIEPKQGGFVQLRAGVQSQKILVNDSPDNRINRQAYLWLDDRKYILRSKFISWFQSVVDRGLNRFNRTVSIKGIEYKITTSNNSGVYTLWITNSRGFRLDVDLMPMLKFPEERWLGSRNAYREIPPGCDVDYWMVVPKPNQFGANSQDEDRSWHVEMHDQENKFLHDSYHLRQGIRLLTKLRDAQKMVHIENSHIKTLFLWKSIETPISFWESDVASIFKVMLHEFYEALVEKMISFFWKKSTNLIENVPEDILKEYANNLGTLVKGLDDDKNYILAAQYLLTDFEYTEYKCLLNKMT